MDDNQKKLMPILAVALLAVAGVVGYVGYQYAPRTEAPKTVENPNKAFIEQKAMECQGDASKLSAEDQQKLGGMIGGANYLGIAMKNTYARLSKK